MARLAGFYVDVGQQAKGIDLANQSLEIVQHFEAVDDILNVCHLQFLALGFIFKFEEALTLS